MIDKKVNEDALAAHNKFRVMHGCDPLKLDPVLAESAQKWANILAARERLANSTDSPCGENLAYQSSSDIANLSGEQATQSWYDEVKDHDFAGGFNAQTGHFTQVIWKSTTHAGFGRARTKDGQGIYIVGHYMPAGNLEGRFSVNVAPAQHKPTKKSTPWDDLRRVGKRKTESKLMDRINSGILMQAEAESKWMDRINSGIPLQEDITPEVASPMNEVKMESNMMDRIDSGILMQEKKERIKDSRLNAEHNATKKSTPWDDLRRVGKPKTESKLMDRINSGILMQEEITPEVASPMNKVKMKSNMMDRMDSGILMQEKKERIKDSRLSAERDATKKSQHSHSSENSSNWKQKKTKAKQRIIIIRR